MTRPHFVVAGVGTSIALCAVALYAALFTGQACGDEGVAAPSPASPRATYCDVWTHPDDRVSLLLGLLFYGPVLAPLLGGVWAGRTGRPATFWCGTAAAVAAFAAHVGLAGALPG